jgi:uncharacterized membrane protein HdeD (DUF308 family)
MDNNKNKNIEQFNSTYIQNINFGSGKISAIICSVLISPVTNPIINMCNNDCMYSEIKQLLIFIFISVIVGLTFYFIYNKMVGEFEITEEMKKKGDFKYKNYMFDIILYSTIGIILCFMSNKKYSSDTTSLITRLIIGFSVLPSFVYAGILISGGINNKDGDLIYRGTISTISGLIYVCSLILGINIAKQLPS